jgi:hypothetical protein
MITEIGAGSLIDHGREGNRHVLRFRSDPLTRERLEGVIAAESECCAFLDLSLEDDANDLVLSVAAPEGGQATADGFASAFAAAAALRPESRQDPQRR